jgi:glycosyltransferase involved in cell wall biosynthesis
MPIFTVAIPAFNEEKYLPTCLTAIRTQDYGKKFETLVVDNNSTDKTAAIAKSFGARVVKETQKGMLFAKHQAFLEAKGEIVATTDADSIVPKNWLSEISKAYSKKNIVATTGLVSFNQNLNKMDFSKIDRIIQKSAYFFLKRPITMRGPNRSIRKDIYLKSGGINTSGTVREDEYYLLPKLKKFGKVAFLPHLVVLTSNRRLHNHARQYYFKHLFWDYTVMGLYTKVFSAKVEDKTPDYR